MGKAKAGGKGGKGQRAKMGLFGRKTGKTMEKVNKHSSNLEVSLSQNQHVWMRPDMHELKWKAHDKPLQQASLEPNKQTYCLQKKSKIYMNRINNLPEPHPPNKAKTWLPLSKWLLLAAFLFQKTEKKPNTQTFKQP